MITVPIILTIYAGFMHAFETDHILAVSNIVSRRNQFLGSLKDGIYWGMGHFLIIFLASLVLILFKPGIPEDDFHYFEALVGLLLIALGGYRLLEIFIVRQGAGQVIAGHKYVHLDRSGDS
ncbi:MAG: urease accessory protein, partial [Bacteroidota bacterium]|nr:urease accessory protein [Bacteroidota bacterium]